MDEERFHVIYNDLSSKYVVVDEDGFPFGQGETEEEAIEAHESLIRYCREYLEKRAKEEGN